MSVIVDIVNSVTTVGDTITTFFHEDIFRLLEDFVKWLLEWLIVIFNKFKIFALNLMWAIAKPLISSLSLSSQLQNYADLIPSNLQIFLALFKIPESLTILISAYLTRFIIKILT
jgi:Protein of unknown function (DUF2523)